MKKPLAILIVLAAALALMATPVKESPVVENGHIASIHVGTTAQIEKAVYGEYAFDMLASGVSELPLVKQDATGTFHPGVASFSTTDSITWTYTVVDGLKWCDGTAVTAEDILFTLQHEDAQGSANLVDQKDSDGKVTAAKYASYALSEDKMSLSLTLKEANVRELANMTSFRIVPKHLYEDGDVTEMDARTTCGPYYLASFDRNEGKLVFEKNPSYPTEPKVDQVVYHIFASEDTMYMALQNGEIQFTFIYNSGVSSTYLDVLTASSRLDRISVSAANAPTVLVFNNSKAFQDVNLRKAVAAAIDYETIARYVGGETAKVANKGFVPEATVGYMETEKLSQDLAAADAYMKAAGYTKASDGLYKDKDGVAFSFAITYRLDKNNQVASAELLKTQLEAFGISVVLDGADSATYNAKTSNKFSENNVSHDAALMGFTTAGMGMVNGLGSIYVDKNHAVQGGAQVDDPAFAAILSKLSGAKTIEEYYEGAHEAQAFYASELPLLSLYWDAMNYVVSSSYKGYTVDNVFGLNNTDTWFSIEAR